MFLSETGHFGSGRLEWLLEISEECLSAQAKGVDLKGVCIYPVTDRPDWDDITRYCQCGIWDLDAEGNRVPHLEYIDGIVQAQTLFEVKKPNIIDFIVEQFKELI